MRDLRVLSLILYISALFVIPVYHITEVSSTSADCAACQAENTASGQLAINELCTGEHPCHNSNHAHHNHSAHDHNCSLCASIQGFANKLSPSTDNTVLDFSSVPSCPLVDDIIHDDAVSQDIDIRGPPIL